MLGSTNRERKESGRLYKSKFESYSNRRLKVPCGQTIPGQEEEGGRGYHSEERLLRLRTLLRRRVEVPVAQERAGYCGAGSNNRSDQRNLPIVPSVLSHVKRTMSGEDGRGPAIKKESD